MKFSVIMPSYLGSYPSAAKNRDEKIVRAINSVKEQTYKDWELLIVSDGCTRTIKIVKPLLNEKIKLFSINKQRLWSGLVRNTGIINATGDWIVYLDIDDMFGPDHLKIIADQVFDCDWYWFNDRSWDEGQQQFNEHYCELARAKCGTSNLCHKPGLTGWNKKDNYYQDWKFIMNLKVASANYAKLETPQYLICHVPGLLDYDGENKKMS